MLALLLLSQVMTISSPEYLMRNTPIAGFDKPAIIVKDTPFNDEPLRFVSFSKNKKWMIEASHDPQRRESTRYGCTLFKLSGDGVYEFEDSWYEARWDVIRRAVVTKHLTAVPLE